MDYLYYPKQFIMDHFFHKILKRDTIDAPAMLHESFYRYFPDAKNIEWHRTDEGYEAIFYEDKIEQIAEFNPTGSLLELKVNITPEQLPASVRSLATSRGELMNAIRIHQQSKVLYEITYRDSKLIRYQMLLTDKGKVIREGLL